MIITPSQENYPISSGLMKRYKNVYGYLCKAYIMPLHAGGGFGIFAETKEDQYSC